MTCPYISKHYSPGMTGGFWMYDLVFMWSSHGWTSNCPTVVPVAPVASSLSVVVACVVCEDRRGAHARPRKTGGCHSSWDGNDQKHQKRTVSIHMGVSKNRGTPKSSILIGIPIVNHPFWGIPIFGKTHIHHSYPDLIFNDEMMNAMFCGFFTPHIHLFLVSGMMGINKSTRNF